MQKVVIERKFRGSINLPDTKEAKYIFGRVKQSYANREELGVHLLFNAYKLKQLKKYQKGGAVEEIQDLEFYIELGEILDFDTTDALRLKNSIELTTDTAHSNFNITKRVTLTKI